jgi:hypothetical protein
MNECVEQFRGSGTQIRRDVLSQADHHEISKDSIDKTNSLFILVVSYLP